MDPYFIFLIYNSKKTKKKKELELKNWRVINKVTYLYK